MGDESRGGRVNSVVCEPTPPVHHAPQTTTRPTPNVDAPNQHLSRSSPRWKLIPEPLAAGAPFCVPPFWHFHALSIATTRNSWWWLLCFLGAARIVRVPPFLPCFAASQNIFATRRVYNSYSFFFLPRMCNMIIRMKNLF